MRRIPAVVAFVASVAAGLVVVAATPGSAAPAFVARGSVEQVYGTGFAVGAAVELLDADGTVLRAGAADAQGAMLFRDVTPGAGYQVRSGGETTSGLAVTSPDDHPAGSWYDAQVAADPLPAGGFDYITTRDGTKLSANVTMPKDGSAGPWPVLLVYNGYDPSQPNTQPPESQVFSYQGYVVVAVNIRGTTCSGGAFEFMEDLVGLDGYDVVEQLARQPWSNGSVGMIGISYGGYTQLYVGATNPPHLDAISPLSPFSDTYSAILYPGGILNNGFAIDWASEREADARPRAHAWVRNRINGGDTTCRDNQALRLQSRPLLARIEATPFADHEFDYLNTETFVGDIAMPTFLSSAWQDEQTGGSAINLAPLFDPDTTLYVSATNGTHVEPMAPSEIGELMVFIDLYVGKRKPATSNLLNIGAGEQIAGFFGSDDEAAFALPFNIWNLQPSYEAALAAYEAQPRVRIRWENGAVPGKEGLPFAATETRYDAWPIPGTTNEKRYLGPDGSLVAAPPALAADAPRAASSYTYDPSTKRPHTFTGATELMWRAHPDVRWDRLAEGHSLSFVSPAYPEPVAYAGQGSVDLWLRSSAVDTDLEVTLTEVRPDGAEVFVQSGWLRASHRALDPVRSSELVPYHTHQEVDAAPLPAGEFTPVRVELFPFAHVIRAGSRLRVNVEAPGGNQPYWAFDALDGTATNSIGHSTTMSSRVVLPRLANVPLWLPSSLPPCSLSGVTTQSVSLRNQPCRTYTPARTPTAVTASAAGTGITVTWTPPPGETPAGYRVVPEVAPGAPVGSVAPAAQSVPGTSATASFLDVDDEVPLVFRVVATYPGGVEGPASDASLVVVARPVGLGLFGTWEAFVRRQLVDLTGSAPAASVDDGVAAILGGRTGEGYLADLRAGVDATRNVDPLYRLYLAYFGRPPDPSGNAYWLRQRRSGRSLLRISEVFAASSEFTTTYGPLGNRSFVELVYRNVQGREGDPAGIAFWTSQLDRGRRGRGDVMVQFSDSNEYRTRTASAVGVDALWLALLGRPASGSERTSAIAALEAGSVEGTAAGLLASAEYAARVG